MKIVKCPSCQTLHAIPNDYPGCWCSCSNPPVWVAVERHLVGSLRKSIVKMARAIASEDGENLSDLLQIKLENG